jgi:hypothetical protein
MAIFPRAQIYLGLQNRKDIFRLPTFTLFQVSERGDEFRAVPGPEARAARAKTMRR